jgi:hypothetical protein
MIYVEVAAGEKHTVSRRSDGSVIAWGRNDYGQNNVPALPPSLSYVEIAAGDSHTVARRSDGSVVAWGDNQYGQTNVPALPPGLSYVEVAAGHGHTVARRSDGSVVAWGDNRYGQCNVPTSPPGLGYVEVEAGYWHTVARYEPSACTTLDICDPALPDVTDLCVPDVSWTGTPDVAQSNTIGPSDFVVTFSAMSESKAANVLLAKSSPIYVVWSTESFRCFPSPFSRTGNQTTGDLNGGATCGGEIALDVEAYLQGGNPLLTPVAAGDDFVVQAWYRDPLSTKTTQMTDAAHFTVCP